MPAVMLPLNRPFLLVWCLTISQAFLCGASLYGRASWCGASQSAIPSGEMPHYQQCLLLCCHSISHYQPCLMVWCLIIWPCVLVWCLTISHAFWCGASLQVMTAGPRPLKPTVLLVECRWKKGGYKSGDTLTEVHLHQTSADLVSLSDMPACTVNSFRHARRVHLFRYACLKK